VNYIVLHEIGTEDTPNPTIQTPLNSIQERTLPGTVIIVGRTSFIIDTVDEDNRLKRREVDILINVTKEPF
jgi:hypothetical protein